MKSRHSKPLSTTGPRALAVTLALTCGVFGAVAQAANSAPTIKLFPTTVVENLKESAETAKGMESAMAPLIARMDEQMKLYQESKCDGNDSDPGCAQIKKALGKTYIEMLDGLKAELPRIEKAMQSTETTLGKRIRGEMGRKMTPRDLARMIEGGGSTTDRIRQTSNRKRGRMSQMLNKYAKLVSIGSTRGESMPLLAMDIYLDAADSVQLIEVIRSEIDRAQTPLLLGETWGFGPTDEMLTTVEGVKSLLFGDTEDEGIPDMTVQGQQPGAFDDSDLRL